MCDEPKSPEQVGQELQASILKVLNGVPDCTMRPTDLSRTLAVSRVMVSRMIGSAGKENPVEALTSIPGPETLRTVISATKKCGVPAEDIESALSAIEAFDLLIRNQYGTRAALNAALSVKQAGSRDQFEQSSRYQVFKGMSQIMGVEGKIWITCTMHMPSDTDETKNHISSVFGPSGMRRLRPDTPIQIEFGSGPQRFGSRFKPGTRVFELEDFCAHTPAPITAVEKNGRVVNTFAPDIGNKDSIYDMLAGVHLNNAMDRVARPSLTRRGLSVIPSVPVAALNIDMIFHKDISFGSEPEAFVYNTSGTGKADFEDPDWNNNRMTTGDRIVHVESGLKGLELSEIPRYTDMIEDMCHANGYTPQDFRGYRLNIQYPVFGFQYVIAFRIPGRWF